MGNESKYPKRDLYQDITNRIIAEMEKGKLPWQKSWDGKVGSALNCRPQNAVTGEPYHKVNALTLAVVAKKIGDGDPRFCSFNQAKLNRWSIKKGSHGFPVVHGFWVDKDKDGTPLPKENQHWERRFSTVFHASQMEQFNERGERVPIPAYVPKEQGYTHEEKLELAETLLISSGAKIYNDQADQAFYRPLADEIHLPPKEAFPELEKYYAVALHELGHWTGHESRLNRNMKNSFGSQDYAKEELRAEMASVYLSMETGFPFDPTNHAAYTQNWLKTLKKDKNELFKAAADAEKITEYVMKLVKTQEFKITESIQKEDVNILIDSEQIASQEILQEGSPMPKFQAAVENSLLELEDVKNAKELLELQSGADEKEIYFAYLKHILSDNPELTNEEADKKIIASLGREYMDFENIKSVITYSPVIQNLRDSERKFAVASQVFNIVNPVLTLNESVKNAKSILDLRSWSNPDEIYFAHLKKVLYENPLLKPEEANRIIVETLIKAKMKSSKIKQCLIYSTFISSKSVLEKQKYVKNFVDNIEKKQYRALAR